MSESKKRYRTLVMSGLLLLVALLVFLFYKIYEVSKENVLNSANMEVGQSTKELEFILQESVTELTLTADMVETMIKSGETNDEILTYLKNETETTAAVFEGNDTGLYGYIRGAYLDGAGWDPGEDYEPRSRPWYMEAARSPGEAVLVEPYLDAQTKTVLMSVSKMLSDYESVVSFDVHLTRMQRQVEKIASSTGRHALVLAGDGFIVASPRREELGVRLQDTDDEYLASMYAEFRKAKHEDFEFTYAGRTYIAFDKPMYGNWSALVIQASESIFSSQSYLYLAAAAVLLIVSLYVGVVIAYTNRRRRMAEDVSVQLQSLADIYVSMYKLDLVYETYEEKRGDPYIRKQVSHASVKPADMVRGVIEHLAKDAGHPATQEFADLKLQVEKLRDTDVSTYEFETVKGWVRSRYIVTDRKGTQICSMLWLMENIDKEKRREEALQKEATHDELTGLYNRRAYESRLRSYAEISPEGDLVCFVLDVNGLKAVNDSLGHAAGDELIKGAAFCIQRCFGSNGSLYRTGGDEFVALIYAGEGELARMTEEFEETTAAWFGSIGKGLSVSYGYATAREFPAASVVEIAKVADDRMYENKREYYLRRGIDHRRGR